MPIDHEPNDQDLIDWITATSEDYIVSLFERDYIDSVDLEILVGIKLGLEH